MQKLHTIIEWQDYPSINTPLNAQNLIKEDMAIDGIDNRVIVLDSTKFDKSEAQFLVRDIEFDEASGIFKITHYNGASYTIDTLLEKLAINFDYDYQTQRLIIELSDGEKKYVDLSALLTQYEFLDSDTVGFTVDGTGRVTADIIEGSIQEKHLRPNYLADIKLESAKADASASAAATNASNAKNSATEAESWAHGGTGIREYEDFDNAMEYARQAQESAEKAYEVAGGRYIPDSQKGVAGGVASLDENGKVPAEQLPSDVGTKDYNKLENKPMVGGITLESNKTIEELGGTSVVRITEEKYDELPDSKLTDGKLYLIDDGGEIEEQEYTESAENVYYRNGNDGVIASDNVQDAIDELKNSLTPIKKEVIWEGAGARGAFSVQLDREYMFCIVVQKVDTNSSVTQNATAVITPNCGTIRTEALLNTGSNILNAWRNVTLTDNMLSFGEGYYISLGTTQNVQNSANMSPTTVYGFYI